MKRTLKQLFCGILSVIILITSIPTLVTYAEAPEKYPYTIFASSYLDGSVTIDANNICMNGNICTNGTVIYDGNFHLNGSKLENAYQKNIYIFDKLDSEIFSNTNNIYEEDYTFKDMNLNINDVIITDKNINFNGNVNLNSKLKAQENISMSGETLNANNCILFSKYGNIILDFSNVSVTGLIYAPFGTVHISGQNVNLNNVIIIADKVLIEGSNANINYNSNMGDFVGCISEDFKLTAEQWNYLPDNDANGIPDFIENVMNMNTDYYDTDNDGLPDYYEWLIKTDRKNPDTDGDGLSDGYEIFTLQTYPYLMDSDDNGVNDSSEDFDKDGLNNLEEYLYETNPKNNDTDYDTLSDFDEINIYITDPICADIDEDGLDDGLELKYNMKPEDSDTLNDGVPDGDRTFEYTVYGEASDNGNIKPKLEIHLKGNQIRSISTDKMSDDDYFLNSELPGYIGNAYDFNLDGEFESAKLSFEINNKLFEDKNFIPTLYYWNENTQIFEEVKEQSINGNIITANLEHFSKYMVMSKNAYEESFLEYEIESPKDYEYGNRTFDVALLLDESGSMAPENFDLMKNMCCNLISDFVKDDRIAVFTFDHIIKKQIGFTTKDNAVSIITALTQSCGDTAIYDAINLAIYEYSISSDATKIIIALTDGEDTASSLATPASIIERALKNNIVIYTVGIGTIDSNNLTDIADSTGGAYYSADNFSQLEGIFERLLLNTDLYKDTDHDGISDYHEKMISAGKLKGGTGTNIKNYNKLNYLNADSDGDGIPDGDELEIKNQKIMGQDVYYCFLTSNPCMINSDDDELENAAELYIGTDVFSSKNTLSGLSTGIDMDSICGKTFNTNTYQEWLEMIDEYYWGYIHRQVQKNIKNNHENIELEYKVLHGFIDVYDTDTHEIWEIKPWSYLISEEKQNKAINQLKKYVSCTPDSSIGGSSIHNNVFKTEHNDYMVTYINLQNGLITYRFDKISPKEFSYLTTNAEQNANNSENNDDNITEFNPVYDENDLAAYKPADSVGSKIFGVIMAGGIITITIADDIMSGGVGVVNDIPAISMALAALGY